MRDFEGKVIKVTLNSNSGWLIISGPFIRMEDDFLIIKNKFNDKVEYISKYFIKYIEILRDIKDDRPDLDDYE